MLEVAGLIISIIYFRLTGVVFLYPLQRLEQKIRPGPEELGNVVVL